MLEPNEGLVWDDGPANVVLKVVERLSIGSVDRPIDSDDEPDRSLVKLGVTDPRERLVSKVPLLAPEFTLEGSSVLPTDPCVPPELLAIVLVSDTAEAGLPERAELMLGETLLSEAELYGDSVDDSEAGERLLALPRLLEGMGSSEEVLVLREDTLF